MASNQLNAFGIRQDYVVLMDAAVVSALSWLPPL
jgi:hypothetical protein